MLNFFWGKFGECLNKPTTMDIETLAALFKAVSNALWYIHTIRICVDKTLEIVYSHIADNQLDNGKTNISMAAFTTCLAHLKLYESLEMLGQHGLRDPPMASRANRHPTRRFPW